MLRIILRVIAVVILLVVLVLGVEFFTINSDPVTVNYFHQDGGFSIPLSVLMVTAFAMGAALTLIVCLGIILRQRLSIGRLKRAVSARDQELRKHQPAPSS